MFFFFPLLFFLICAVHLSVCYVFSYSLYAPHHAMPGCQVSSLFYQCFMCIHRSVFVRSVCQCVCRHGMSDVAAVNIFVQYHRDVFGKLYVF